jgi:DNA-binding NarL/FixJ family response regulator
MTIRVLVADDQSMVRAGFRMLLANEPDIDVVAEASNGRDAVHQAARFEPTVVLVDIRMPELDGLEAARRILAANDAARILILTTFDLDEYVYEALSAGASGFVRKDDPPEQLIAAREHEVFRLIALGLSNAEIGQALYISEGTVKTHVTHLLQKLGLRDRVQAVVLAYRTGLVGADHRPPASRDEPGAG